MNSQKWKKYVRELKKNRQIYILVMPVLIFFLLFMYGPMYGAIIAFLDYKPAKGILGSEWLDLNISYDILKTLIFLEPSETQY